MERALLLLFFLAVSILTIGYDARPIARCGVSLCTVGVITNKEFKLW